MRGLLLALVVLLAVVAVLALVANARPEVPAPPGAGASPGTAVYLALGDSVAAGVGAAEAGGEPGAVAEQQRAEGYPGRFATVLAAELDCPPGGDAGCPGLRYDNRAVPGATTTSFLADQLPAATALLRDGTGSGEVRVVTLTIGGNDLFGPVVQACVTGGTPESATCRGVVEDGLAGFADRYDRVLGDLRAAAGPDTVIVATTYYNSLRACDLGRPPSPAGPLADVVLEGSPASGTPEGMNDVIRAASARHGAVVADAYDVLREPDHFVGGADCLHPSAAGHQVLADLVAAAWRSAAE